jgi:uncharacterized protein
MPHTQPARGQFVWYTLTTGDRPGSASFYGRLFGWTVRDLHAAGAPAATTFRSGDRDVCGLVVASRSDRPARWVPCLSVNDVEAAVSRARQLGGELAPPPGDEIDRGRLVTVLDPSGAPFCPAAAAGELDPLADAAMPGHFCWSELLTADPARAAAFYGALFGWTASERDLDGEERYWVFRQGDRDVAGMMQAPGGAAAASCWLPYVQVVSAEDTAALAEEAGGQIVTPPGDVPGRGRSAVVKDPGGALVAVFALTVAA